MPNFVTLVQLSLWLVAHLFSAPSLTTKMVPDIDKAYVPTSAVTEKRKEKTEDIIRQ